jgi:hypothetical protein
MSGRDYYFKSLAALEILGALTKAGFNVATDVRKPDKLWQGTP